jgi:hypothetical protein
MLKRGPLRTGLAHKPPRAHKRADMAPIDFVGADVEVVGAERGPAFEHGVALGLAGEDGVKRGAVLGRAVSRLKVTAYTLQSATKPKPISAQ